MRMCIDFQLLSANTILNQYPILCIDNLMDCLHGTQIFSKIDLGLVYQLVAIRRDHQHRTAFMSHWGFYEYMVMPLGLVNAPATF